jgi:hypothetical protein
LSQLSVVAPPEEVVALPPEEISFDLAGLDSFRSWSLNHRIIDATLVRETGLIRGARFGRVLYDACGRLRGGRTRTGVE